MNEVKQLFTTKAIQLATVLLILLTTACRAERSLHPEIWRTNTIRLIGLSADVSGGYSEAPLGSVREPTPYATFYLMRTRRLLGGHTPSSHAAETVRWIKSLASNGRFHSDQRSGDVIGEIYYGLSILEDLETMPLTPDTFAQTVYQLQLPHGPYAASQGELQHYLDLPIDISPVKLKGLLLPTYEALVVLTLLDRPPRHQVALTTWLQDLWDERHQEAAIGTVQPATLSRLIVCLQIVAPDDPRLQMAWRYMLLSVKSQLSGEGEHPEWVLLDIVSAVEAAQRLGIEPDEWRSEVEPFLARLVEKQNPDGGYNAFLQGASDVLGTYSAARIFQYFGHPQPDTRAMLRLIELHRVESGGYFPMSDRPVNLAATWGVVQSSPYLNITLDRSSLTRYLETALQQADSFREIRWALESAQLAGIDLPPNPSLYDRLLRFVRYTAERSDLSTDLSIVEELDHAIAALDILGVLPSKTTIHQITSSLEHLHNSDGGYGPNDKSMLQVTDMVVMIYRHLGHPLPQQRQTVEWMRRQQRHGGFAEPGQEPLLSWTYLTVMALDELGAQPTDLDAAQRFVAHHLLPAGGANYEPAEESEPADGNLYWTGITLKTLALLGVDPADDDQLRTLWQ